MSLLNAPTPHQAAAGAAMGPGSRATREYWRSLDELADTPEFRAFVEREFPAHASEMLSPFTRRTFLSLMGASMAFAGLLTGCRKPVQHIVPYSKQPENMTPGMPNFFATSFACAGQVVGTIAKSHDFRPIKLEGNPAFPTTLGALDSFTQALILQLYDPDRSMTALQAGQNIDVTSAGEALAGMGAAAKGRRGAGLHILSEPTSSPSLLALRSALLAALPEARWHVWTPINHDAEYAGAQAALGRPLRTVVDYTQANIVVALDADVLGLGPESILAQKQFSRRRKPENGAMNRLYSVETMYSITGAMADHRMRLAPGEIQAFATALGSRLGVAPPAAEPPAGEAAKWLGPLVKDIQANAGKVAFVAGSHSSPALHALAAALNARFGGDCVKFVPPVDPLEANQTASISELTMALGQKQVETLLILGGNPVYDAPAELKFGEALKKAITTVHLSLYVDETSRACVWHLPMAHTLESWGDVQAFDGTLGLTQPLLAPLYGGLTQSEVMSLLFEAPARSAYDILYQFHRPGATGTPAADREWNQWLHDGFRPATANPVLAASAVQPAAGLQLAAPLAAPSDQGLVLQLRPDYRVHDGRFANNGWLQELADPISKLTWDNAAYLSQKTAQHFKLATQDVIRIKTGQGEISAPVTVLPGVADFCIVLNLGFGRKAGGRIAAGEVGVNAYELRAKGVSEIAGVKIEKTSRTYTLANVQDHWSMENRPLILEGTTEEYAKEPAALVAAAAAHEGPEHGAEGEHEAGHGAAHADDNLSPFREHSYERGPQWGMSIDLSACTGCGACTIACFAENNIPIVGKEQVRNGREMAWIRIDRYYATPPKITLTKNSEIADSAEMVMQPMACQHCENAPCEQVCPVAATTHSPDGLNEMTYNRCVGTRYCSNNCPFKVRRFNFFNYQETDLQRGGKPTVKGLVRDGALSHAVGSTGGNIDLVSLARNPDVTVRGRGVMEKCTFCVQRIRRTTQEHKVAGQTLKDGAILTACQQTCPSEAIVFGDTLDPQSALAKQKALPRNYELLSFLRLKTRTTYLARLRNPNPELVA